MIFEQALIIFLCWFYRGELDIDYKTPADLVTEADRQIQEDVKAAIKQAFPDHDFIGNNIR